MMMPERNRKLIAGRNAPLAAISLFVAVFVLARVHVDNGYLIDGQGFVLGRDFLNFWHYGLAAWRDDAARFYDIAFYNGMLDKLVPGYDYPDQSWSYPPHYMLLAAPFGLVGYNLALAIYTALGLWLYWKVVVSGFEGTEQRIALFATPTLTVFLLCGQVSALIAVLLVAIYRTLDRQPVVAGLLIALMTVKPQIGLLIPLFLILTGRWKVFFVAALGTLALVGMSMVIHGVEVWRTWVFEGIATQSTTLTQSNAIVMGLMPTAFVDMILIGVGRPAAIAVQAIVSLLAVGLMWWTIRVTQDWFLQFAALIAASFIVTPYLMAYDTLVLGWVMLMLAQRAEMNGWQAAVYFLAMAICPVGVALALIPLPGTPLVLIGVGLWVWREAAGEAIAPTLNRVTAP
jgi:Glycosyltransferase family 87